MQPRYGRIAPLQNEDENTFEHLKNENSDISGSRRDGKEEETWKPLPKQLFTGAASAGGNVQNYKDQEQKEVFPF